MGCFLDFSDSSLFVFGNGADFCILILYPAALLNSLMSPSFVFLFFFFCFVLFFSCGRSAPVGVEREVGTAAWLLGTLVTSSVHGHGLPPLQELWPDQSLFTSLL